MSKKKITIISFIISIIIILWTWTIVSARSLPIAIGGSTSANTFMQNITSRAEGDYAYNSTGSQNGVNGVFSGVYAAGVLSKNPDFNDRKDSWGSAYQDGLNKDDEFYKDYIKSKEENPNKYTALEFALDSIIVIYHPPVTTNLENGQSLNFDINSSTLKDIYEGKITDWSEIADGKLGSGVISFFTRENGSGTRTEFEDKLNITTGAGKLSVVNSNGMMYNNVTSTTGSIGFVSKPFALQIPKNSNVYIAGINGVRLGYEKDETYIANDSSWYETETTGDNKITSWKKFNDDTKSYELSRPFVIVYKNKNIKKIEKVLWVIFYEGSGGKHSKLYEDEGLEWKFEDLNKN